MEGFIQFSELISYHQMSIILHFILLNHYHYLTHLNFKVIMLIKDFKEHFIKGTYSNICLISKQVPLITLKGKSF